MTDIATDHLRARARDIRRTAALVDACSTTQLVDRAGDDTWIGPTPQACHDDLVLARTTLRSVRDEMIRAAVRLEVEADLIAAGAGGPKVLVS